MEDKNYQVVKKILQHVSSVIEYCTECHSLDDFENNSMRVEACVFNMMQIGELAKTSLSEDIKSKIKNIPWNQLYGMRNRIVHGYSGVDMCIVWETISCDLPVLQRELEVLLGKWTDIFR